MSQRETACYRLVTQNPMERRETAKERYDRTHTTRVALAHEAANPPTE